MYTVFYNRSRIYAQSVLIRSNRVVNLIQSEKTKLCLALVVLSAKGVKQTNSGLSLNKSLQVQTFHSQLSIV